MTVVKKALVTCAAVTTFEFPGPPDCCVNCDSVKLVSFISEFSRYSTQMDIQKRVMLEKLEEIAQIST